MTQPGPYAVAVSRAACWAVTTVIINSICNSLTCAVYSLDCELHENRGYDCFVLSVPTT